MGKLKVALLPLRAGVGTDPRVAEAITDSLVTAVQSHGVSVITMSDLGALLGFEQKKQLAGCADNSCLAELDGAHGVDRLVVGSLAKVGSSVLFNLQLLDPAKATVLARHEVRLKGGDEDSLLDVLKPAVAALFAPRPIKAEPVNPEPIPQPVLPATAAPGGFSFAFPGAPQLNPDEGVGRGITFALYGSWHVVDSLRLSMGATATPTGVLGPAARVAWYPLELWGVRPVLALEAFALLGADPLVCVGGSAGLEVVVLPWLFVSAEVPAENSGWQYSA